MNGTQTVDKTIEQVERLYESVTGRRPATSGETPYAAIPPEKDPKVHVEEQIERLIDTLARVSGRPQSSSTWVPPISIWQGPNELALNVDLPGVDRDSLRLRLMNGAIELSGRRTAPGRDGDGTELRYAELPFGMFRRVVPLPRPVSPEELQAELRDGVLTIRIARQATGVEAQEVEVR